MAYAYAYAYASLDRDEICRTRLLKAARFGNLACLKRLANDLDEEDDLQKTLGSIKDENGFTVLHHAASGGNTDVCRYLVDEVKVDHINLRGRTLGETPLLQAIKAGHCNTAAYLLEKGADPNVATDDGDTPLHYAVMKGYEKLLHLLISKGAKVDAKSDSSTSLVWAASFGNKKAMKVLLDNKANPNMIHLPAPSPLIESVLSGSFECVELLLKAGADPNVVCGGVTALHAAVLDGADTKIIKCLLDANANPNAVDRLGNTPVEYAAMGTYDEAVMILLPLTSPFQSISEWSYDGIVKYLRSNKPPKQRDNKRKKLFLQMKSKGEAEVKRKEYINAIYWYTECYLVNSLDATIQSNLSYCWALLNNGDQAMVNAKECVALRPDWPNAHYREGVAWNLLEHLHKAAASFKFALKLDPQNKEIRDAYRVGG